MIIGVTSKVPFFELQGIAMANVLILALFMQYHCHKCLPKNYLDKDLFLLQL